jgi:hypothetical protein
MRQGVPILTAIGVTPQMIASQRRRRRRRRTGPP